MPRYNVQSLQPGERYILSIILLLLSQSGSFSENVHKRVVRVPVIPLPSLSRHGSLTPWFTMQVLAEVPWFKDRILTNISLGSLVMVVLLKASVFNLAKLHVRGAC